MRLRSVSLDRDFRHFGSKAMVAGLSAYGLDRCICVFVKTRTDPGQGRRHRSGVPEAVSAPSSAPSVLPTSVSPLRCIIDIVGK
jgi:hypothetical protein